MYSRFLVVSALAWAIAFSGCAGNDMDPALWFSGNRMAVYNISDAPLDHTGTTEQAGERIRRAAGMQGWDVQEVRPQVIYVTKRRGSHSATASITYDNASFSINLRGSNNLKQPDTRIHKLYNEWIRELESTIEREVSTGY